MNKSELIDALSTRLAGDKKTAAAAVEGIVDVVSRAVAKGEKVAITGFGVFEKRARNARTARNPRTGASIKVKKTSVPAFRPGQNFKDIVSGAKKVAKAATASAAKATTARTTKTAATKSTAKTTKAAPAKKSTATSTTKATSTTSAPAKKTAAGKTTATKAPAAKTTTAKTTAKKASS